MITFKNYLARLPGIKIATISAAVLSVCYVVPADAKPERSKITVGIPVMAATFLPVYIAEDKGLYKKEGLEVKVLAFRGGSALAKAVIAGNVDIGVTSLAGMNVGIAAKQPLKSFYAGFNMAIFDWYATPKIKSMKDVKGTKWGISRYGSSTDFLTRYALTAGGYNPKTDVKIIQGGRSSTRLAAQKAGQLDINIFIAPQTFMAANLGYNKILAQTDLAPDYPFHVFFAKEGFIKSHHNTIIALLRAHVKSVRIAKSDKQTALKSLASHIKMDPKYLSDTYDSFIDFIHEDGRLPSKKGLDVFFDMGIKAGTYKSAWPKSRYWISKYTDSYNQWKP
ncbi:MAG: ABC transporter substrate-binding protein [Rhodospirillales bacterium]